MLEALWAAVEAAALAVWPLVGRGDKEAADGAAVAAMRRTLLEAPFAGTVVIGEGEMDEAPMLYIGERVGGGGEEVDVAVDPLEGTELVAKAQAGAVTAIAVAPRGSLLHAPDMYMEKLFVGPMGRGLLEEGNGIGEVVEALRRRKGDDVVAVVLDRPRHEALVAELRRHGARVHLIAAGDMMPAVATCLPGSGVDLVAGRGGAPEGVLAAAAVRALGGDFAGRLVPAGPEEERRLREMGAPLGRLGLGDLCRGEAAFACAAVTDAWGLPGIRREGAHALVSGLLVERGTARRITALVPM
jgi:fructose-1,6-bisphosphatase II